MSGLLRVYEPSECGPDGYPLEWHRCPREDCRDGLILHEWPNGDGGSMLGPSGSRCSTCGGAGSIKDLVRQLADHRCVRCGHPYRKGQSNPEWSPCDERCDHGRPYRVRYPSAQEWTEEPDDGSVHIGAAHRIRVGGAEVEAHRRVLTVHHLTGSYGNEQEAKRDCRWWNLVSLCQRCHLSIQARVNMQRAYPWEHSDWMQPYVAGFYAAKYLGEDLSRLEVVLRLDELLELGQREESVERMAL